MEINKEQQSRKIGSAYIIKQLILSQRPIFEEDRIHVLVAPFGSPFLH